MWVFVHQLGYFWCDGTLTGLRMRSRLAIALGGLTALVVITSLDVYPRSMVAVEGAETSHLYPTTARVAALALFQLGVALVAHPALARWLERRAAWKPVVAVNAVIMTLFVWHMTALLAAMFVFDWTGGELLDEPRLAWWVQRPLWILLPALFLAGPLALFSRFGDRRPRLRLNVDPPGRPGGVARRAEPGDTDRMSDGPRVQWWPLSHGGAGP